MRSTLNIALLALARSILAQEAPIALECIDNDIVESIPDDSDFSYLKAALQYVEFDQEAIISNQPFTLLAPTNEALAQLFPNIGTNGLASLQPAFVAEILLNHIFLGQAVRAQQIIDSPEIQNNPIATVLQNSILLPEETVQSLDAGQQELIAAIKEDCESGELEVDVVDGLVSFSSGATTEAIVTIPDIALCTGVVHAINTVLLPSCEIKDADLTATVPSIAALDNIDVEGAGPALGIGTLLDGESPITAPDVNAIPFEMAPMPTPALEPEDEVETPGPALVMEEIEPDSEVTRDIDIEGPAGGPGAAVPPTVEETEPPVSPGVAEPPTASVEPETAEPVEGPAAAEPPTVVDAATPSPEVDDELAPQAGVPTIAVASRAGVAEVEAPGPVVDFFAETFDTGVEASALTPEAAEALITEPGFDTVEVDGQDKLCIDLTQLEAALTELNASLTSGVKIQSFINFILNSPDLLEVLGDPDTTATVFIPIQEGIAYLRAEYPEALDASSETNFANQLLKYHIIPGFNKPAAVFAAEAFDEPAVFPTLVDLDVCEETLSVDVPTAGSVEVNGVPVIQADLVSCDSRIVFHIIEGILIPQCGSEELEAAREASAAAIEEKRLDLGGVEGPGAPSAEEPNVLEPGSAGPGSAEPGSEDAEPPNAASIASMSISAVIAVAVAILA